MKKYVFSAAITALSKSNKNNKEAVNGASVPTFSTRSQKNNREGATISGDGEATKRAKRALFAHLVTISLTVADPRSATIDFHYHIRRVRWSSW